MNDIVLTTKASDPVLDFMRQRRSVPAKTIGRPGPDDGQVRAMAEIAARIPDHGKLAPWRFVLYSKSACERLGDIILQRALDKDASLTKEMQAIERQRMLRSPVVIGLISTPVANHPKIPVWEQELSCGASGLAWLIAANAHGFDAQWLTEWIAFDEMLAPHFGCKPAERIAGFIHIGTRTMPKTERDRPNLDNVLTIVD